MRQSFRPPPVVRPLVLKSYRSTPPSVSGEFCGSKCLGVPAGFVSAESFRLAPPLLIVVYSSLLQTLATIRCIVYNLDLRHVDLL